MAKEQAQLVFRLNHTMPMTDEYDELLHRLYPNMGEGSRVNTPLTVVRHHEVKIGRHVVIMNGCLMMSLPVVSRLTMMFRYPPTYK